MATIDVTYPYEGDEDEDDEDFDEDDRITGMLGLARFADFLNETRFSRNVGPSHATIPRCGRHLVIGVPRSSFRQNSDTLQ